MPVHLKAFLLASLAVVPTELFAQSYIPKPYHPREVAGWTVGSVEDEGGSCMMYMDYEGIPSTRLALIIDWDSNPSLMIKNRDWTVKKNEKYKIDYELSFGEYRDHPTLGWDDGGLYTKFDKNFSNHFAKSNYLNIYRDGIVIDKLSLKGSGAAVAELRRCVAHIQREADAINRERRKFDHIPSNPFAGD